MKVKQVRVLSATHGDAVGGAVPAQVVVLTQATEARDHAALRLVGDVRLQRLGKAHVAPQLYRGEGTDRMETCTQCIKG